MYRDDRDALLARLEAVTRENEQLRARNAEHEHPAPLSPATNFDIDSFLAEDEPQPHQTLRGHAPAWVTTRPGGLPPVRVPPSEARQSREIATLIAVIGFAALVTVGCFLLLIF